MRLFHHNSCFSLIVFSFVRNPTIWAFLTTPTGFRCTLLSRAHFETNKLRKWIRIIALAPVESQIGHDGPSMYGNNCRFGWHFSGLKKLNISRLNAQMLLSPCFVSFARCVFSRLTHIFFCADAPLHIIGHLDTRFIVGITIADPNSLLECPLQCYLFDRGRTFRKLTRLSLSAAKAGRKWFQWLRELKDVSLVFPSLEFFGAPQLQKQSASGEFSDADALGTFCRALPALKTLHLEQPILSYWEQTPTDVASWNDLPAKLEAQFGVPLYGLESKTARYLWCEMPLGVQLKDFELSKKIFSACYDAGDVPDLVALDALGRASCGDEVGLSRAGPQYLFFLLEKAEAILAAYTTSENVCMLPDGSLSQALLLLSNLLKVAAPPESAFTFAETVADLNVGAPANAADFVDDRTVARIRLLFFLILGVMDIPAMLNHVCSSSLPRSSDGYVPSHHFLRLGATFGFESLHPAVISSPKVEEILWTTHFDILYRFVCTPEFAALARAQAGCSMDSPLLLPLFLTWLQLVSHLDDRSDGLLALLPSFALTGVHELDAFPPPHAVAFLFESEARAIMCAKTFTNAADILLLAGFRETACQSWATAAGGPPATCLNSVVAFAAHLNVNTPDAFNELLTLPPTKLASHSSRDGSQ